MSGLFTIPLSGLKEGGHSYNFEIVDEFFELFEGSEITSGDLNAVVELDKRSTHMDLRFSIKGSVTINCDRCLEPFLQSIECENRLLIKFGKNWDENDPDILTIPADEFELDVKQYLYEFIYLSLPIKRTHPLDKSGKSTCDPEMLKKINEHTVNIENDSDPRWDELRKLMNNN
jgi:uncharacterized metal-binding protein YceD (DUF177 family)